MADLIRDWCTKKPFENGQGGGNTWRRELTEHIIRFIGLADWKALFDGWLTNGRHVVGSKFITKGNLLPSIAPKSQK